MLFYSKKQQLENQKTILRASIFSFVLGVLFAVFTSPIKGSQARKIIKNKVENSVQNLEEKVARSAQYVQGKAEDFRENIDDSLNKTKHNIEENVNETRTKIADKVKPQK